MSKPTFAETAAPAAKKPRPKEETVVWIKKDKNGNDYLSIKITEDDGTERHFRAFKIKEKKSEAMPDYVGYKKEKENKDSNAGTNQNKPN